MSRARKYATTTEAAIRALVEQGLTNKEVAQRLNLSESALAAARGVLGITSQPKRAPFAVKSWWLPAMAAGATVETICKAECVTYPTVYGALRRAGLPTTRKGAAEYMAAADSKQPPASSCGAEAPRPVVALAA